MSAQLAPSREELAGADARSLEPPTVLPQCGISSAELRIASKADGAGRREVALTVPGMHCGACVQAVENALTGLEGVVAARANLSARRVRVHWQEAGDRVPPLLDALSRVGFDAHLPVEETAGANSEVRRLLRALAVAGFGAGNIMLLSVSVWAGADPETRDLFHWISAAIALPVLAYSGQPFFRPAIAALRRGRSNMDVPISVGVLLAFGLSLYDTALGAEHAYFDAAVTLVFFLLAGRALEAAMRHRARSAAEGLRRLAPRGATVVAADGSESFLPVSQIAPGMKLRVGTGAIVPADGCIEEGSTEIDASLATGESAPQPAGPGSHLLGGTRNLTGTILLCATRTSRDSFLAEIIRMVEQAEDGRSAYRRIADRVSRLYAPVVHLAALASAVGWALAGASLHDAIAIAVAVLIITCPCALGLAAPLVQAIAARRLFQSGVLVRGGEAIERLGVVDTVLFDKTGVITSGQAGLRDPETADPEALSLAQALAEHSRHPLARAIAAAPRARPHVEARCVTEIPGNGIEAQVGGARVRLGRPDWALVSVPPDDGDDDAFSAVALSRDGKLVAMFHFDDALRQDAGRAVEALFGMRLDLAILSGDRPGPVNLAADRAGISDAAADLRPEGKCARIQALAKVGRRMLMVGDGLNDAPALAAAHASMAPAEATEIGRSAADLVFVRRSLLAVPDAVRIARRANRLMRQNFVLAILYNAAALPFAVAGTVTPLFAAIAMSSSSLIVAANALRLNLRVRHRRFGIQQDGSATVRAGPWTDSSI